MLLQVPDLLTADQVASCRKTLEAAEWVDGRITAGHQSARAKIILQLREDLDEANMLCDLILGALERNPLFISASLPLKVFPPLFKRYHDGQSFVNHVNNSIRKVPGTP